VEEQKIKAEAKPKVREQSLFFGSIDGAPQWADTPQRPEAGGKELEVLASKTDRLDQDPAATVPKRESGRTSRWAKEAAPIPTAAASKSISSSSNTQKKSRPDICRSMLGAVKPAVDESVIDYVVSLVEDDVSDDIRDAVFEILEGHDVPRNTAEVLWMGLTAT